MELKRILCLDLDGTVRRSKSGKTFIEGPDDVELIPGVKELAWHYKDLDYFVVGITNQAGVAHGFKLYATMDEEVTTTIELCRRNGSGLFDNIYACTADPKGKIAPHIFRSLARKPDYGMLVIVEYNLVRMNMYPDWDNSLFVGDRPEDEECAKAARVPFMHIDQFLKQQI